MSKFKYGQIIPITILNNIDNIIQQLKSNPANQQYINDLISLWEGILSNMEDVNIADNIERIKEKQNSYINQ